MIESTFTCSPSLWTNVLFVCRATQMLVQAGVVTRVGPFIRDDPSKLLAHTHDGGIIHDVETFNHRWRTEMLCEERSCNLRAREEYA